MFDELTAEANFNRIEEDVRRFWRRHAVPEAFHTSRSQGPACVVYRQPLMAAGGSATDKVPLLAAADLMARYRTMRGEAVHRHAGWVCHGLPIEVAVERSLGPDLAGYDLAQFNAACRKAAIEGVQQGEALAERLGVWAGPSSTFLSLEPQLVGLVWNALRRFSEAGRLRSEHCVTSFCPRCATPLSSAEATRRSLEVETRSVWVRLPWDGEPNAYFLAWTPQPWMLAGMVALAAHPEVEYALVELSGSDDVPPTRLLLAETSLKRSLPGEYRLVRRLRARMLRGARYHPPFTFLPAGEATGRLLLSEAVPLDQGTGLWPVTPAFDPLSLTLAQSHDMPLPRVLDDAGGLGDAVTPWRGLSPLDAEPLLVEDLQARGLLVTEEKKTRPQALCPHCETSLLPLARSVWLVETGSGSWVVSRDRAWGVPLPVWVCEGCGQELCVAGLDDLARRTGLEAGQIDPHRPAVDRLTFPCENCGGTMRRVAPVVDAAFEAAVLSWSTAQRLDSSQPGGRPRQSLAVGLGDRHLGWLGDFAEVAALLQGALAWEQALALPEGEPDVAWDLERISPADALRWAAYTGATPDQAERDFLRPLWRLAAPPFGPPHERGGSTDLPPVSQAGSRGGANAELLDRWLAARLDQTIAAMTQSLDTLEPRQATAELASLVNDLVDWYVPNRPDGGSEVLQTLCRLLAPFVPHLAEALHRHWSGRTAESVHLAAWPLPGRTGEDLALLAHVDRVRHLAALGQNARAQAGIEPDRKLRRAVVGLLAGDREEVADLSPFEDLLAAALGVSRVYLAPDAATQVAWRLRLNPEQRVERDVALAEIEAALSELDAEQSAHLASHLWAGLSVAVRVSERPITLLPDEVLVSAQARPGWAAAADAEHLVLLEALS